MHPDLGRTSARYPRCAHYDLSWVIENRMGPNPLWLTEWLAEVASWSPGDRVLDLGCGTALSSVFLAKEFGAEVFAADLWIDPADNWSRIRDAGAEGSVWPFKSEARSLPFARGFFDSIVSIDAFHYFGTDGTYLGYLSEFVTPGGLLALVVPGVRSELDGCAPRGLEQFWHEDMRTFHSCDWWADHVSKDAEVLCVDWHTHGAQEWLVWSEVCADEFRPRGLAEGDETCAAMLRADEEQQVGLLRLVARLRGR